MIWAATWDFQQFEIFISVDSDEPLQPPFKLRNSKWCSVSSLTLIEYSSDEQRLWSDCAYAQADLRLCWSHMTHCWKPHALAHLGICICRSSPETKVQLLPIFFSSKISRRRLLKCVCLSAHPSLCPFICMSVQLSIDALRGYVYFVNSSYSFILIFLKLCERNSSYSFIKMLLKLCKSFAHGQKMCM